MKEEKYLHCVIEDNGAGRKVKEESQQKKRSLATTFVRQRLDLLNKLYDLECSLIITDKPANQGIVVTLTLPILNRNTAWHYAQL
jgi:hypothetical protein